MRNIKIVEDKIIRYSMGSLEMPEMIGSRHEYKDMTPDEAISEGKELQRLGEEVKTKQGKLGQLRCPRCGTFPREIRGSFHRQMYCNHCETLTDEESAESKDLAAMEHLRKLAKTPCGGIKIASELGYIIKGLRPHHIQIGGEIGTKTARTTIGDLADAILAIQIEEK